MSLKPSNSCAPQYPVIGKREQPRTQGQQMAGEVAAVHRRDVARRQRLQRLACRTSCRNALGAAPGRPSCAACSPCARRAVRPECSRSRRRTDSPAAPARCWSAMCDARPRQRDAPDSCRAAANDPPGRRRSSKNAQVRRASARRKSVCSTVRLALRRASGRLIHQAMAGEANHRSRIGAATVSAAGVGCRQIDRHRGGDGRGRSTSTGTPRRGHCGAWPLRDPRRSTDSIRAVVCA